MENEKMKIGIDIDEIIAEYLKSFLEFLNSEKKISINYNEVLNYNYIGQSKGLGKEQIQKYIQEHTAKEINLVELELIEGCLEAINLLDDNHKVCFITSRHISNEKSTIQFFKKHFPDREFKIIFSGDIWGGNKTKSEICKEENCEIMIEDNADYALDCAKKDIKVLLLDKPWNKNYEKHENITKVENWKEILEKLEVEK
jgi:uncharacterized HAD superfamily protein